MAMPKLFGWHFRVHTQYRSDLKRRLDYKISFRSDCSSWTISVAGGKSKNLHTEDSKSLKRLTECQMMHYVWLGLIKVSDGSWERSVKKKKVKRSLPSEKCELSMG